MLYIHDTREIQLEHPSVVSIGKFDGFHRGHRKLLTAARSLCSDDRRLVLFTFSHSPQMVMAGQRGNGLNSHEEKLRLAEELGVDVLIEYPFTEEVRHISAESFLRDVLCGQLRAEEIVAGPDCSFGYGRRGNIEFLRSYEQELGFRTHVIDKENYRFTPISSTRIREALAAGHVEEANEMLGYRFGYKAKVEHGRKLGRMLGFPTINQKICEGKVVPAFGVYASLVLIDGAAYPSISNIGVKPTVGGEERPGIETSILEYEGNLYGSTPEVVLLKYIRPERKFSSLDTLRTRVEKDKEEVRSYFDNVGV